MCIGNRVNLHLFLTILTMFFWDEEIMILSNNFRSVGFKLPFTWALATCGLLCGSVALQYTWNLLTFSLPVLRGGTVHGLCHSPSYEFVFINIVRFMMSANSRIRFGLQNVFVCLYITPSHFHHCANFIWRHWTYKMPVRYSLSSVWVRLSIFSQLSIIQYVCVCVGGGGGGGGGISVYPFPLWWLREYIYFVLLSSSNQKYELLPIV